MASFNDLSTIHNSEPTDTSMDDAEDQSYQTTTSFQSIQTEVTRQLDEQLQRRFTELKTELTTSLQNHIKQDLTALMRELFQDSSPPAPNIAITATSDTTPSPLAASSRQARNAGDPGPDESLLGKGDTEGVS